MAQVRIGIPIKFHKSLMNDFQSKNGKSYTRIYLPSNEIDFGTDQNGINRNERKAYILFSSEKLYQDKKDPELFYTYVNPNEMVVNFQGEKNIKNNSVYYDQPESVKVSTKEIKKLFMKDNKEIVDKILRHVSIIDLADQYFGIRRTGNSYSLTNGNGKSDFSSMKLFPDSNSYRWYANDKGGNVIQFVIDTEIEGINNYNDAVIFLAKRIDLNLKIDIDKYKKSSEMYELNSTERAKRRNTYADNIENNFFKKKSDNLAYIVDDTYDIENYLIIDRHLDEEIVKKEIEKDHIKECIMKNGGIGVAFIGYRPFNNARADIVSIRSIEGNFKSNISGSNMEEGFIINSPTLLNDIVCNHNTVYCFEGYIDMLSYMTLAKMQGKDLSNAIMIACASTNNYKAVINYFCDDTLDRLDNLYHDNEEMMKKISFITPENLVICFDNDNAGRVYGNKLENELKEINDNIQITKEFSYTKDWNEDLVKLTTDIEYEREVMREQILEELNINGNEREL